MHTQPDNSNNLEPDASSAPQPTVGSQPWWRGSGYNSVPPTVLGDTMSESPSLELPNGAKTSQPQANGGLDEGSDINKETHTANAPDSGSNGNCRQEQQHLQHAASAVPPTMGGYLVSQPQLVGHSVACAPYPYSDQYCAGVFTAYGNQALVHPYLLGMHHTRMPLPLEMAEEPVYVNAKQYHGILRRRQSRAKAELEKKVIKDRKPYLHESRHQHAMRRTRGCGGRFLNTKNVDNATSEKAMDSCTATSTQPTSEPVPSEPQTYSNGDENGC